MDFLPELLYGVAPYVHFIAFGLLLLAGLNLPVSEDIVYIVSASIAATIVPQNTALIFAGCFAGAYISDIMAYFIGKRFIGGYLIKHPALANRKIVKHIFSEKRISCLKKYFDKYGSKTLFFGRFVPLGLRNILFMTCGIIDMKLSRFMIVDICALACTSAILFYAGYSLGQNYVVIFPWLDRYKLIIFILLVTFIVILNRKKLAAFFSKLHKKTTSLTINEHGESKYTKKEKIFSGK